MRQKRAKISSTVPTRSHMADFPLSNFFPAALHFPALVYLCLVDTYVKLEWYNIYHIKKLLWLLKFSDLLFSFV